MHRESSKVEYQALQLMTHGIISHYPYGLFLIFKFQAFSINLSAQYMARSIKWKSQTKSLEEFLGLFRFRATTNVINGYICCIFNSLHQQNTARCNLETIFLFTQAGKICFSSPHLAHNNINKWRARETAASTATGRAQQSQLLIPSSAARQYEETFHIPECP